jgi:D-threo-aldose 1-dehydrogenase
MRADRKHRLGRTGVAVTALGLGTVGIGNLFRAISDAEADATVQAAWDAGIRYFDTAALYGHGLAELRLGRSLRDKRRDDFVVSSKVGRLLRPRRREEINFGGFVDAAPFEVIFDYSFDGTMRAFEDSLQRLALERMDICFIHDVDVLTWGSEQPRVFAQAMDGCWRALERLRADGVVKAIGLGVNEWQVCRAALDQRDVDCFLLAGRYTLLEQGALDEFLPLCEERNVSVVIGGGFNSGILATGSVAGARYNYSPAPGDIIERIRRIEAVCRDYDVPLPAAAMQFVMAHPAVSSFVTGARTAAQLRANLQWFSHPIPGSFWSDLKAKDLLDNAAPVPVATG